MTVRELNGKSYHGPPIKRTPFHEMEIIHKLKSLEQAYSRGRTFYLNRLEVY